MNLTEAVNLLGNRPVWELKQIKRALSSPVSSFLNTHEDDLRLDPFMVCFAIGFEGGGFQ